MFQIRENISRFLNTLAFNTRFNPFSLFSLFRRTFPPNSRVYMFHMVINIFKFFIVDSSILLLLLLLKLGLMALRTLAVVKPVWMKQAEEAKLKSEAEKAVAAKAALEATFRDLEKSHEKRTVNSDSESDEYEDLAHKPIGPVDPSKCTAAGTGVAGGTACAPSSFAVVTKDADERKVSIGGADIKVKVTPGLGVGGSDQEGIVKDMGDGTYTVTYVVPKRGNYMVNVECNGKPIMGSPFPVFFSAGYRLHLQVKMESTTSATTKKVKNYMPYDLQLVISSKLPLKSVKRFGCLCKSWDLNFENPRFMSIFRKNFISNHHSYYDDGTSLLLNITTQIRYFPTEGWLYSLFGEKFENKHKIDWPSPFPNDNGFDVVGYTTGTLCLFRSNKVVFWNPATKEFKVIPHSPYVPSCNSVIFYHGFGFDNIRDDYKLIRHVDICPDAFDYHVDHFDVLKEQTSFEPFWEIYSLRSNSWKKLDVDTPPSHMFEERAPGTRLYTEGMCHWWGWDRSKTDNNEMCYGLSSFDLGNEVFIATPITPDMEVDLLWFHLILLNGSIALISYCMGTPTFHISVLGELGVKESWTKVFIIGPLPCIASPVGAGKKGDLFFIKEDDEIVYFDLSTQKTHELGIKGFNAHTLVYKERFIRMDGIYN